MKKVVFPLAIAVVSAFGSSSAFSATPYKYDLCAGDQRGGDTNSVKGDRYVLAGSSETYSHEVSYSSGAADKVDGRDAYFYTGQGLSGSDEYSFQDFKQVAKKVIQFPSRGSNFVQIVYSIKDEGTNFTAYDSLCKNVNVQSAPTVAKKESITNPSTGSYHGEVTASYDTEYSKAAIEGENVRYLWYFQHSSSSIADFRIETSVPFVDTHLTYSGGYSIFATVFDGVYSDTVRLGGATNLGGISICVTHPQDCTFED